MFKGRLSFWVAFQHVLYIRVSSWCYLGTGETPFLAAVVGSSLERRTMEVPSELINDNRHS